jgi:hypothetical protein
MYSNGTGSNSVAVGYQALSASTASNGTAVGYQAALNNTSGSAVVAIGHSALKANTTGNYGVAIGANALLANTTADGNIGIGINALIATTTGANNTSLGTSSGSGNTTSSQNTFLGYNSGSGVTTGGKNVILGSYTGSAAPISATGSNFIVLSDGDGNVRQTYNSSGAFGIGSSPSYGTAGQVLTSGGSGAAPTWATASGGGITSGTAVATTSGTSIGFTGLPSTVKRITLIFQMISTNGGSFTNIQLGTGSTTYTTSGYTRGAWNGGSSSTGTGFLYSLAGGSGDNRNGMAVLTLQTGNTWVCSGNTNLNTGDGTMFAGYIALGATLTAVRISTVNGTDSYDNGLVNIFYES